MWLAVGAACAASETGETIGAAETVIGRARLGDRIVLLTDAPALFAVDVEGMAMTRQALDGSGVAVSRLWGLAAHTGRLFTISAFDTLVEIDPSGKFVEVARLARPVLNLIDLEEGMAVQLASQPAGSPLLSVIEPSGVISAFASPLRTPLGLTPPEEGLLHLLSCSAPPAPICWLPGDVRIFAAEARALVPRYHLKGLSPPDPATLIASPERRVIEDAILDAAEGLIILRNRADDGGQRLIHYKADGTSSREIALSEPLRLLVSHSPRGILAVARTGRLVTLER